MPTDPRTPANGDKLDRYIRLPEVMDLVALKRSAIYQRMADGTFPMSFDIGGGQARWLESEIEAWRKSRPRSRAAA